jgi:hypothetical protein
MIRANQRLLGGSVWECLPFKSPSPFWEEPHGGMERGESLSGRSDAWLANVSNSVVFHGRLRIDSALMSAPRNAPKLPALPSQAWGDPDEASRCPSSLERHLKGRGFACPSWR